MWLIEIFDLHAQDLREVEDSIRAMEGVGMVSALRDGQQPYVVAECPTERDAIRVQEAVAAVDPTAIVVTTRDDAESQELVGL